MQAAFFLLSLGISFAAWIQTNPSLTTGAIVGVVYGNAVYVMVALPDSPLSPPHVFWSSNTLKWNRVDLPVAPSEGESAYNLIFAPGIDGGTFYLYDLTVDVWTSRNGKQWTRSTATTQLQLPDVAYGNGLVGGLCNEQKACFSSDGIHFEERGPPESAIDSTLSFYGGYFLVAEIDLTGVMWLYSSRDGTAWRTANISAVADQIQPSTYTIAGGPDGMITCLIGEAYPVMNSTIYSSMDGGVTWKVLASNSSYPTLTTLQYVGGVFLWSDGFPPDPKLISADGVNWQTYTALELFSPMQLFEANNTVFAASLQGQFCYTTNVTNGSWIAFNEGIVGFAQALAVGTNGDYFVSVNTNNHFNAAAGSCYSSTDGKVWQFSCIYAVMEFINADGTVYAYDHSAWYDMYRYSCYRNPLELPGLITSMAYGNQIFVLAAENATTNQAWIFKASQIAGPWTQVMAVPVTAGSAAADVAFAGSSFVVIVGGTTHVSTDASTWTVVAPNMIATTVSGFGNLFFLNGVTRSEQPVHEYIMSSDGMAWSNCSLPITATVMEYHEGLYWAVTASEGYTTSPDGVTWTYSPGPPGAEEQLVVLTHGAPGLLVGTFLTELFLQTNSAS